MEFANRRLWWAASLAACAATALLIYFGNGLNPRWPLMWLAPLPVLLFALRSSWWAAALVTALAWLAGCMNLYGYFHRLGLPPAAWLGGFGLTAVVAAAAVLLFRALFRRGAVWSALLAFPAAWVTFEYIRNLLWPHGSSGCLAYSQLRFLPFLQMASLTGPWGMGFVLLLFPAGLAIAWHLRAARRRQAVRVLAVTLGTIAALLIFGAVRLARTQPGPQVRVGLAASDRNVAAPGAATRLLLESYAAAARQLAAKGAQAVVLPEKIGIATDSGLAASDAALQTLADNADATIVAGVDRESPGAAFNQARVYRRQMEIATYDKEHLLPPFESKFTPGKALLLLHKSLSTWGVAICKDMDFTQPARKYGSAGVGLMLVPAWDFNVDRAWHGHIAIMRGVEDGFSVVRAAKNGYLTVSDNRGRILAEVRSDSAPLATLLAEVPAGHSATLFLLLGDWFAWVAMGLLGWSLIRLWI